VSDSLTDQLEAIARKHGAAGFGVAGVEPFHRERVEIRSRKQSGLAGPLRFTYDDPDLATDVTVSFPWGRSLVVVAWSYLGSGAAPAGEGAVVGRFATTDQYQGVRLILSELASLLHRDGYRAETLIDDNRLVDRAAAVRSGVGWTGKSTMTLVPGPGPWVLLGSLVTDAPLTISEPMSRSCGVCTACIPACPTNALGDWGLDARRCLSTWLQTPGSLPHWIRPRLGRRIYGCDDCLEACPPGRRALAAGAGEPGSLPFSALLELGDEALVERFDWWYVPRRDGRYLRRNLLVAAGNSGEPEARESIERHMRHPSSMIRGHAAWALATSLGLAAAPVLRAALETETAPETREELRLAGLMVERPGAHRELLAADEWARGQSAVRGLALIGHDAEMELLLVGAPDRHGAQPESGGHRELRAISLPVDDLFDRTAPVDDLSRVYDPDRILGRWRTTLRLTASLQV